MRRTRPDACPVAGVPRPAPATPVLGAAAASSSPTPLISMSGDLRLMARCDHTRAPAAARVPGGSAAVPCSRAPSLAVASSLADGGLVFFPLALFRGHTGTAPSPTIFPAKDAGMTRSKRSRRRKFTRL